MIAGIFIGLLWVVIAAFVVWALVSAVKGYGLARNNPFKRVPFGAQRSRGRTFLFCGVMLVVSLFFIANEVVVVTSARTVAEMCRVEQVLVHYPSSKHQLSDRVYYVDTDVCGELYWGLSSQPELQVGQYYRMTVEKTRGLFWVNDPTLRGWVLTAG